MQRFLIISLIVFNSFWGGIALVRQLATPDQRTWQAYTSACLGTYACWMGITPSSTTREEAIQQLQTWPTALTLTDGSIGSTIQWLHPEGFQGGMRFDGIVITFFEVIFYRNSPPLYLGDVILTQGAPDAVARFPDGSSRLYYDAQLLIIEVDTRNSTRLYPHQRLTRLRLISPIEGGVRRPSGLIPVQKWKGFGKLPPIPPYGP